ncbi:MAG: RluA family pseudouridine synthase [Bacilli bacterium]|nr:RluA family pseudouridine synthase [Bacilli bacterium]
MNYQVSNNDKSKRLDNFLMEKSGISRSKVQKSIREKDVLVNGNVTKSSYIVKENDVILFNYKEETITIEPEKMDLDIVYEDDDIIVINKKNGVVVHPSIGNTENTLVNGLMYYADELSEDKIRPGIVHRIDAYTTGLLVVAKNRESYESLTEQLKKHTVHRRYWALVWGIIKNDSGTIDAPIGRDKKNRKKMAVIEDGKPSITHFKVLERYNEATLIELNLETGRTHQIRVHMNYIGYPIVNDPIYGRRKTIDDSGQCLHAKELGFIHPKTLKEVHFNSDIPECFNNILQYVKSL